MNDSTTQALWLRLKTAGLVTDDAPPASTPNSPWFVRVMLGVAGWIGALFLLIFVGMGFRFVMDSSAASFIVGVLACTAAGALFRAKQGSDFAEQFGLAVSLAGQALVLIALFKGLRDQHTAIALSMALFQLVLFIAIPNFIHRVWAAWTGAYAMVFVLSDWHLQAYAAGLLSLACAWVWLNEFRYAQQSAMLRAGGYGLVLTLMGVVGLAVTSKALLGASGFLHPLGSAYHLWLGAGLSGIALLWAVRQLLIRESVTSAAAWRILAAAGILALVTLKAPGLAPAVLILLLGYSNNNRVLFGLGVTALLGYLSFYYYSLEATLLYKSALLTTTGFALLAARFMLLKWWPASEQEDSHA